MTPSAVQTETARWVVEAFSNGIAEVLEAMAGARPETSWDLVETAPEIPEAGVLRWKQALTTLNGELYLWTVTPDALAIGNVVMLAAGVEDSLPDELQSTFLEVAGQAFSILARKAQARVGREITPTNGQEASGSPGDGVWGAVRVACADSTATLYLCVPPSFLDGLTAAQKTAEQKPAAQVAGASAGAAQPQPTAPVPHPSGPSPADDSKTFELLLDVELPVSVSFGHAQIPLKDVLKLTTGSIVELSRAIVEPVDVVVNNCVIARGEVVVVEGNFGVRIQQVVSRTDRLRTLQ